MSIDSTLTVALAVGEITVLALMIWRRMWRTLPVFTAYMLWSLISDTAGLYFLIHGVVKSYFTFYATQTIIDAILMFAVLVELGWSVLSPVRNSLPRGTKAALVVLIGVVALIAWPLATNSIPPAPGLVKEAVTFEHIDQTFIILRVIFFLVMVSFSQLLSIGWRDRELQIATGLGVYAIVSLLVALLNAHQTDVQQVHKYHLAVSISYLGSLGYWVLSFAAKEYQRKEFSPQMQQFLVYMGGTARSGSIALTDIPPDRLRKRDK